MGVIEVILVLVVAAAFLAAGGAKLAGADQMVTTLRSVKVQAPLRQIIGGLEVAAAVGLLIGLGVEWIGVLAALGLVLLMIGAVIFHVRAGQGPQAYAPAAVLGVLSAVVLVLVAVD